jgi:hypothetical protein
MSEKVDHLYAQQKHSFWKHHLEHWQQSGLSQLPYCREHQLKTHRFYFWRQRILKPQ